MKVMGKIMGLFLACVAALPLCAQDEELELFVLKDEQFENPAVKNDWAKPNSAVDSFAVDKGALYWRSKAPQLGIISRGVARLSDGREHTIKARIIRESLQAEHRCMLVFGYGRGDFCSVAIKRNDFQIYGKVDGLTRELTDYKRTAAVRPDTNDIRVHHQRDKVDFYINETLVYSYPRPLRYAGDGVGLGQSGNGAMRVDYIKVEQWDQPMRVLPDAHLFGEPERLSDNINTQYPDYVPIITHDGQQLYFIRRDADYIMGSNKAKSDIFVSNLEADGSWGAAVQLDTPINNQYNNAICTVMPDNNSLYLLNQYFRSGKVNAGMSLTRRGKNGWEYPDNQEIMNYNNKSVYADMLVTPNGKVLIMSIETLPTEGDRDLYVSFLQGNNSWSPPQNMGKVLNTKGADFAPFLAADGKSLYFSSTGHPGYGGADVFVSRRLDDSWTNWEKPYNLGNKVNTENFDAYYTIPAKGDYAYYVSNLPATKADIYRIALSPMARPERTVLIEGYVKDKKTEQPLAVAIRYESLTKDKELGLANPRPEDGYYQIMVPYGEYYGIMATAAGYFSVSTEVDLQGKADSTGNIRIRRDLWLAPLEKNVAIRLNNVFFDSGKHDLLPLSISELQRLALLLQQNPNMTIQLEGHTDDVGADAANKALSERRVQSVRAFLVDKNISASRIKTVGYGETKPIVKNINDENRAQNRRVDFRILSE